jgi:hypothetical protein
MLEFASFSEGGKSKLFCLDVLVPVQRVQRADERTRTADLVSLRVRFEPLYLSRKAAYLQRKLFVTYRRVTLNYAQVSVPVSVR